MITVHVQYAYTGPGLPDETEIQAWVTRAVQGLRDTVELTVRIVDQDEGTELNERWRKSAGATNVLSFPSQGVEDLEPDFIGDIVICGPVVNQEASQQNKSIAAHWTHMVIHGTLHLLGYDHEQDHDAETMERMETEILNDLGINNPYI